MLTVAAVGQIVLAIVLYNNPGNTGLRNAGWGVLMISGLFGWLPIYTFRQKGGVAKGKGYVNTTVLVNSGVYGIVRHPQYLAGILMSLALAMLAQNWVVTLLGAIAAAMYYVSVYQEEASSVEKFGEAYTRYMREVPRFNFVAGIWRRMRHDRTSNNHQ